MSPAEPARVLGFYSISPGAIEFARVPANLPTTNRATLARTSARGRPHILQDAGPDVRRDQEALWDPAGVATQALDRRPVSIIPLTMVPLTAPSRRYE